MHHNPENNGNASAGNEMAKHHVGLQHHADAASVGIQIIPKQQPSIRPSIGRTVHFTPPQECVGPESLLKYPAIITQINPANILMADKTLPEIETVELATFGPNSLYFQHKVPFAPVPTPGHWNWPVLC